MVELFVSVEHETGNQYVCTDVLCIWQYGVIKSSYCFFMSFLACCSSCLFLVIFYIEQMHFEDIYSVYDRMRDADLPFLPVDSFHTNQ